MNCYEIENPTHKGNEVFSLQITARELTDMFPQCSPAGSLKSVQS